MIDFFNKKTNSIKDFDNILKEKESEIERLNKELEGAKSILIKIESEMTQTYTLFKENENNTFVQITDGTEIDSIFSGYTYDAFSKWWSDPKAAATAHESLIFNVNNELDICI